jgi:hypothetical protein
MHPRKNKKGKSVRQMARVCKALFPFHARGVADTGMRGCEGERKQ